MSRTLDSTAVATTGFRLASLAFHASTGSAVIHTQVRSIRLLRPLPAARGTGIALPASIIAAFAVFGILLSFWWMIAYRPFGGFDFRRVVLLTQSTAGAKSDFISASNSVLVQTRARSFTEVARLRLSPLYAKTRDGSMPINVAMASPEFLNLFKAVITRGRGLENRDEPWPSDGAVGIVSESWWRDRMGGAEDVPGRRLETYDRSLPSVPTVGVLSQGFRGFGFFTNERIDLVLPFPLHVPGRGGLNPMACTALALLAPESTIESARREVALINADLKREGLIDRTVTIGVRPASSLFRPVRQRLALATIATAIAFLLIFVCAAGVLQVRAVDRIAEISIRQAFGATRRDLVLMLIGENLQLFLFAGLAGSALAALAIHALGPIVADGIGLPSALDPASIRWLPFATIALVPLLAVLVSAAQILMLISTLRSGTVSIRSRWTPGRVALRRALVLLQGAAAAGLAFAAVASIHALIGIESRGLGFETAHLLSARVSLPILGPDGPAHWSRFYSTLIEELKRLPAVRAVGVMRHQAGERLTPGIIRTVEPLTAGVVPPVLAVEEIVHPTFFREMGVPALEGRLCDAAHPEKGQPIDVINEAMSKAYWPNGDALGKHLRGYGGTAEIVGIVPSVRNSLFDAATTPKVFVCFPIQSMHLLIRYSGSDRGLQGSLLPIVRRMDFDGTVDDIVQVDDLLDRSLRPSKVLAGFLGTLGAMAVAVSGLGLFAIAALVAGQCRTEFAVRIAVGADPLMLGRKMEAEGLALGSFGVLGGWLIYSAFPRYFPSLGVQVDLPWHLAAQSAGALLAVMWLAVKWPAYRLRQMDVMAELKQE
jgi:putative ABC transport system permease protein